MAGRIFLSNQKKSEKPKGFDTTYSDSEKYMYICGKRETHL